MSHPSPLPESVVVYRIDPYWGMTAEEGQCSMCGDPTYYVELEWRIHLCSDKCFNAKLATYSPTPIDESVRQDQVD